MKYFDQFHCKCKYWLDYPREDLVIIDDSPLSDYQKEQLRNGKEICYLIPDCGGYVEYYIPIQYDSIPNIDKQNSKIYN